MTESSPSYFFCGLGGSGMLPLALILQSQGAKISGSDRAYDQGRTPEKFDFIQKQGISLFPQDGSGITEDCSALVTSAAVEVSIPDVQRARALGIPILLRAELLAMAFNKAETRIGIAGTSGKSTTTGMIGYVLKKMGRNPTVMNGAVFRNFVSENQPYATALLGSPDLFVSECDESDGSVVYYEPTVAVLTNISLDHKSVKETSQAFLAFLSRAKHRIVNLDNPIAAELLKHLSGFPVTFGIENEGARFVAHNLDPRPDGISCEICDQETGETATLSLMIPGQHNVENALACIAVVSYLGAPLSQTCRFLESFQGVKRRMEIIGTANGVTVIDDFAHNPDKIAATLSTLNEFSGRVLILFQLHGYGPLSLMHKELAEVFQQYLAPEDRLYIPEVLYLGGTTDQSFTAQDFVKEMKALNVPAQWFPRREDIISQLVSDVEEGDRIVVMGARDDSLTMVAKDILAQIETRLSNSPKSRAG